MDWTKVMKTAGNTNTYSSSTAENLIFKELDVLFQIETFTEFEQTFCCW